MLTDNYTQVCESILQYYLLHTTGNNRVYHWSSCGIMDVGTYILLIGLPYASSTYTSVPYLNVGARILYIAQSQAIEITSRIQYKNILRTNGKSSQLWKVHRA